MQGHLTNQSRLDLLEAELEQAECLSNGQYWIYLTLKPSIWKISQIEPISCIFGIKSEEHCKVFLCKPSERQSPKSPATPAVAAALHTRHDHYQQHVLSALQHFLTTFYILFLKTFFWKIGSSLTFHMRQFERKEWFWSENCDILQHLKDLSCFSFRTTRKCQIPERVCRILSVQCLLKQREQ